jgi:hypothetical protein
MNMVLGRRGLRQDVPEFGWVHISAKYHLVFLLFLSFFGLLGSYAIGERELKKKMKDCYHGLIQWLQKV